MRIIKLILLLFGVTLVARGQSFLAFQRMEACIDWSCAVSVLVQDANERHDVSIPWRLPLRDSGYLSSRYGYRTHPIVGTQRFHAGIDIAAPTGSYIYAAGRGLATYGYDSSLGNHVVIDHLNGFVSVYGHLSASLIPGQACVKQGQVIGIVGESGLATGPHVHWSVTFREQSVDPLVLRKFVMSIL